MKIKNIAIFFAGIILLNSSCSNSSSNVVTGVFEYTGQLTNKGIGPVTELKLDSVNSLLATQGKIIFEQKCVACHRFDMRLNGPPLNNVTKRRSPEWIMNMILNPAEMIQKDAIAKDVFSQLNIPMVFQDVTQEQTRAILEYLRQRDSEK
jgi:mono/diheme cytochrome c family protein